MSKLHANGEMFNHSRLIAARQRRKVSAKALAEKTGLNAVTISRLENDPTQTPETGTIQKIASALGYPEDFFYGDDVEAISDSDASFRSLKGRTAKEKHAALAAGSLSYMLMDFIEAEFDLPTIDIPYFERVATPKDAAYMLRTHWGIGYKPIGRLISLLESKGVRIFSLCENTNNIDAFSCWRNEKPYVYLNTQKTAERSRFDLAHELGHIILHRHGAATGREAEREADEFASYFLIPPQDLSASIGPIRSFDQILMLKTRWGVSAAALCYRLHKDGYLSDWIYRSFCIHLARNFSRSEPNGIERESSQLLSKVFQELWKSGMSKNEIARTIKLPLDEVESLTFGLINQIQNLSTTTKTQKLENSNVVSLYKA
jgi:Zn-dependent peptidase ImmA (M78 family)/DNA-binding Xre family transcriptional regulator